MASPQPSANERAGVRPNIFPTKNIVFTLNKISKLES
jgi:hypothetical protein